MNNRVIWYRDDNSRFHVLLSTRAAAELLYTNLELIEGEIVYVSWFAGDCLMAQKGNKPIGALAID